MRLKFFRVPVEGGESEAELGSFWKWIGNSLHTGCASPWVLCVVYLDGDPAAADKGKIDKCDGLASQGQHFGQRSNFRPEFRQRKKIFPILPTE